MEKDKQFLDIPISIKQNEKSDSDSIIIEGWANKSKSDTGEFVVDRDGDVVLSFDLTNYQKNPIILYQHNQNKPAGVALEVELTDKGLYIKAEIYKDVNQEAFNAVKRGVVKTFSVGFRGKDGHYDPESDIYYFSKTELLEVSLVSVPANQDSIFSIVDSPCGNGFCLANKNYSVTKSNKGDKPMVKEEISEILKEFKADIVKELSNTSTNVSNEVEELSKEEVLSMLQELKEEIINEVTSKSSNGSDITVDYIQSLLSELQVDKDNIEDVVKMAEQLNKTVNDVINELLN